MRKFVLVGTLAISLLVGCESGTETPVDQTGADSGTADVGTSDLGGGLDAAAGDAGDQASTWNVDDYFETSEPGEVDAYQQRPGDAARGYDVLVNAGYVSCGIPARIYDQFLKTDVPDWAKLPGRRGANAELPYDRTQFERDGIDLVSTNCLACHANRLPTGEFMVGLGNEGDFTQNLGRAAELGRGLVDESNVREVEEYDRFLERTLAAQPYIRTNTVGVNPADNLAGILVSHRDADTWEWLPEPWFELPVTDPAPLSVPPWWNVKKKNALYFSAIAHGDHARFMMAASLLCTDTLEEAQAIDEMFVHVNAYIESIEAPEYPYAIDEELAATGEDVFEANCSRCHGTYGETPTYPNLIISLEEVGTDSYLAESAAFVGKEAVAWFNRSFFGEIAKAAPAQGYVAPPLDGIWATAPYFHNASVPTLTQVIDSSQRPTYWTRNFNAVGYDQENVGFVHTVLPGGKDSVEAAGEKKLIYDTTLPGYGNEGHTFGDQLDASQRTALIEYLKTL